MSKTLTVITVTYNAASSIEKTVRSVVDQSVFAPQIEYIIIDGGSKDNTLEKIAPYQKSIAQVVSEPDFGIYDAMNKGIKMASAPWILFMNAGDELFDTETVASLQLDTRKADHILYGDCTRVYTDGRQELRKALPWWQQRGIPSIGICHQSIYLPTAWAKQHPFRWQEYPHCADFEQIHALKAQGCAMQYVERSLSLYEYGVGFSSSARNQRLVFDENARILGKRHTLDYYKSLIRLWLSLHK